MASDLDDTNRMHREAVRFLASMPLEGRTGKEAIVLIDSMVINLFVMIRIVHGKEYASAFLDFLRDDLDRELGPGFDNLRAMVDSYVKKERG